MGSYNEASGRYKQFEWECYVPNEWRTQDKINKQGSLGKVDEKLSQQLTETTKQSLTKSKWAYENNLHYGVAREQARIVMPMAQYTEFFWTVNFRSLANFVALRSNEHAQKEIQDYSNTLYGIINNIPEIKWACEIFSDMLRLEKALAKSIEENDIEETIKRLKQHYKD